MQCWTAGRTAFEYDFTVSFPDWLQPFVGGGEVCDSWDSCPGIVSTDTCVCIRPSLASRFPRGCTSEYTCSWTSFADLTSLCLSIVLIQQGNCGRKPLMFCLFWRVSKMSKIRICFSRRASADLPKTTKVGQMQSFGWILEIEKVGQNCSNVKCTVSRR